MIHTWIFTKKLIDWEAIEKATHNQYRVVSVRPYVDKKGKLPEGYTLTLTILRDDYDYGADKATGEPRENNLHQNFKATVLTRKHSVKKGDFVRLLDFDEENSFAMDFELLLRFRDMEIIQPPQQKGKANA